MMTILQIYCVQRIGPANPHWAIYYLKAIVHNPNQVIIYVKNAFFLNFCWYNVCILISFDISEISGSSEMARV